MNPSRVAPFRATARIVMVDRISPTNWLRRHRFRASAVRIDLVWITGRRFVKAHGPKIDAAPSST